MFKCFTKCIPVVLIIAGLAGSEQVSAKPTHGQPPIIAQCGTSFARTDDVMAMACNVYGEAQAESVKGKFAVGFVTINRTKAPDFPGTIPGVVWSVDGGIHQFSWTMNPPTVRAYEGKRQQWEDSMKVARYMIRIKHARNYEELDFTHGATHFNALGPGVWPKLTMTMRVGGHRFYIDKHKRHIAKVTAFCDVAGPAGFDECMGWPLPEPTEPQPVSLVDFGRDGTEVCHTATYWQDQYPPAP